MSSCSLVIVHASLKNMVFMSDNSCLPQFFEFRPEILHVYFWMHIQSNNDEKKIDFLTHLQEKLPLIWCEPLWSARETAAIFLDNILTN